MGRDLVTTHAVARRLYEEADDLLDQALSRLCFEGPKEALDDTVNTQPAIFVTSLAMLEVLRTEGELPQASLVAGHSLGELTALTAVGAMEFADGLRLVRERGRLMKLAGEKNPGGMAAVLKAEETDVETACREASAQTGQPVQIANYNSPGQLVISGHREALERAISLLRAQGIRRIIPLAVSIAAHSPLMVVVMDEFRAAVDATAMRAPRTPVVANISARPLHSVSEIRDELAGQLTWPVRWVASVQWMVEQGVTRVLEVGPKDVLTKLIQRIDPDISATSIGDVVGVQGL
jgi:[acyl-carrier-protein] S-malonyltransferase